MRTFLYTFIAFIYIYNNEVIAQTGVFPEPYTGLWEGELKIYNTNIKSTDPKATPESPFARPKVTMQLEISKNDTGKCWNFTIRYISQGKTDERKYLLKRDSFSGSFIIDEQNSVKLYTYLMGDNMLVERFSLPENDITSLYKFGKDTLVAQIISSETVPVTWTGSMGGIPKIYSYLVNGYQDAILVRKKK